MQFCYCLLRTGQMNTAKNNQFSAFNLTVKARVHIYLITLVTRVGSVIWAPFISCGERDYIPLT
jgi:hypothetical protein